MTGKVLFLTGKLAAPRLKRLLESLQPPQPWEVRNIGISVAALMTTDMVKRRLVGKLEGVAGIVLPGLCGGDIDALAKDLGVPVQRGPAEMHDLPAFLQLGGKVKDDLAQHDILIFAEVTEAPRLGIEQILEQAERYRTDGADVIDIGFLPGQTFPHLEETIQALKEKGHKVSADTGEAKDLIRAGQAGADYLLSLRYSTLWVSQEVDSIAILIPEKAGDMKSLYKAIEQMAKQGKTFYADSILDPLPFGMVESIVRYRNLRKKYPEVPIMIGTGNVTELLEADTSGVNAILFGMAVELNAGAVLTTEVSSHASTVVHESDVARRVMYAARRDKSLAKGYSSDLCISHQKKPHQETMQDIKDLAKAVTDPSYRIMVSEEGIHAFNRDGHTIDIDPMAIFTELKEIHNDPPHAFYMGMELARAQIAWQLGRSYGQDRMLEWGAAIPPSRTTQLKQREQQLSGTTLKASKQNKKQDKK